MRAQAKKMLAVGWSCYIRKMSDDIVVNRFFLQFMCAALYVFPVSVRFVAFGVFY